MNIRKDLFNHQDTQKTFLVKKHLDFILDKSSLRNNLGFDLLGALGGSKELAFGGFR